MWRICMLEFLIIVCKLVSLNGCPPYIRTGQDSVKRRLATSFKKGTICQWVLLRRLMFVFMFDLAALFHKRNGAPQNHLLDQQNMRFQFLSWIFLSDQTHLDASEVWWLVQPRRNRDRCCGVCFQFCLCPVFGINKLPCSMFHCTSRNHGILKVLHLICTASTCVSTHERPRLIPPLDAICMPGRCCCIILSMLCTFLVK